MDIKLIPVEKGSKFTFPALPEKVQGKYAAKYQSFDIISLGTVRYLRGRMFQSFRGTVYFSERQRRMRQSSKRMPGKVQTSV